MKTRNAGKGKTKKRSPDLLLFGLFGVLMIVLFALSFSTLKKKEAIVKQDKTVSVSVDWIDLEIFAEREDLSFREVLEKLDPAFIHVISVPGSLSSFQENLIRQKGFRLLWRWENQPNESASFVLERMEKGDGVLSYGDVAAGYPREIEKIASVVRRVEGFYPLIEFAPQKGRQTFAQLAYPFVIKGHCLQAKERLTEKAYLWMPRLMRAARERWVRYFSIQMSPSLTLEENISFIRNASEQFGKNGFVLGPPEPLVDWSVPYVSWRKLLVFILPIIVPLLLLYATRAFPVSSPILFFLIATSSSVFIGVILHALGSSPWIILGLEKLRGIKLQLLIPFVLGFGVLLSTKEWKDVLVSPIKGWHVLLAGFVMVVFAGGYLMRSGNFPLIPVLEGERVFRDTLESFFGARPRFKEFLIGHPLLILGLFIQSRKPRSQNFLTDGRFFLGLGILGQISVLNTFLHFHSPIELGLLRTLHGAWLGILFSVPLCYLWMKKK